MTTGAHHGFKGQVVRTIDALSPRERTVFGLLIRGWSTTEIADAIFRSVKTVSVYRARLHEKLGIVYPEGSSSNRALVEYAEQLGLLKFLKSDGAFSDATVQS